MCVMFYAVNLNNLILLDTLSFFFCTDEVFPLIYILLIYLQTLLPSVPTFYFFPNFIPYNRSSYKYMDRNTNNAYKQSSLPHGRGARFLVSG